MAFSSRERLREILSISSGKRVLVVGDLILDHYVETIARKLAREAPIPVGEVIAESSYAGGAGNLACNISSLGGKVSIVGIVGRDYEGEVLRQTLANYRVDADLISTERVTSLQTRYYVDQYMYLRIDREICSDIDRGLAEELLRNIESKVKDVDCICISDYDKGTITPYLIKNVVAFAKERKIPVYGQPRVKHYLDFIGFDCIKSDMQEARKATGISLLNESSFHNMGIHLLTKLGCKALVLTRGRRGLTAFEDNNIISIPSLTSKQLNRTVGIRDAMTAILSLALVVGANIIEASMLSSIAAAVASPAPRTFILRRKDIEDYMEEFSLQEITNVPLHR